MHEMGRRIYLSSPHMSGNEQNYIEEAFKTNWIAPLGRNVDDFEKDLSAKVGVKSALATNSGTAALHLALLLAGVGSGDRVFCSALSFVASANPILYCGAEPVFIDSDLRSWNISPFALKVALDDAAKKDKLPKALIVVDLYGQCADMDPIFKICEEYEVTVIEDAAEALGASYRGKAAGSLGHYGVFSFNGNKIITTSGGGMLISDCTDKIEKARFWSTQSRDRARHYQHSEVGYNYRMSNVLAGIGRGQLEVLEERVESRRAVFEKYYRAFSGINGIEFMPEASYGRSTRWLTALTVEPQLCGADRDDIINKLEENNIEARPVWKPLQLQPLFEDYSYYCEDEGVSVSERLFEKGVCLPSGSNMSAAEQDIVIDLVRMVVESK